MTVPYNFATATGNIPLAQLDANFQYYDAAFSISGTTITLLGVVTMPNNTAFKFLDSTAVARNTLFLDASNNLQIQNNVNNGSIIQTLYGTGSYQWTVGGAEQMRLNSTGLVLGSSSPLSGGKISALVDLSAVNGLVLRDTATTYANNNNYTLFQNSTNATVGGLTHPAAQSIGVWGFDDIRFLQGSGPSEQMRLNGTGLGIGTSSPSYKLDVTGTLRSTGVATLGTGATTTIATIGDSGTVNTRVIQFTRASVVTDIVNIQGINAGVGPADISLQASGGSVGIGTSSPNANTKIDSSGPIRAGGYTVATLPTGVVGARAYVTDAVTAVFMATPTGGGSVKTPVFFNGSVWVCG